MTDLDETEQADLLELTMANEEMSLEQAVSLALIFHPQLAVYEAEVRVQDAERIAAGVYPNPVVDLAGEEFGGVVTPESQITFWVRQEIVLSSRRHLGQMAAIEHTEAAQFDYLNAKIRVIAEVRRAFVEAWIAQERAELIVELRDAAQEVSRAVELRVEYDEAPELEMLRAQVDLEQANVEIEAALAEIEAARAGLTAAIGLQEHDLPPCHALLDDIAVTPPLERLELVLLDRHPAIRAAQAEIRALDLDGERADADAIPNLEVGVAYHRGVDEGVNLWSVGLGIPIPLFDYNQGERAAISATADRAVAQLEVVQTEQLSNLRRAYPILAAARTVWQLNRTRVVPLAEETFERASEAYRLGESDYLSLLDARRRLNEAQIETLEAKRETYLSLYELEFALGALLAADSGPNRRDSSRARHSSRKWRCVGCDEQS